MKIWVWFLAPKSSSQSWWHTHILPALVRQRQVGPWSFPTDQPGLIGDAQILVKDTVSEKHGGWFLRNGKGYMYTCIHSECACTYIVHICTHIHTSPGRMYGTSQDGDLDGCTGWLENPQYIQVFPLQLIRFSKEVWPETMLPVLGGWVSSAWRFWLILFSGRHPPWTCMLSLRNVENIPQVSVRVKWVGHNHQAVQGQGTG